MVRRTSRKGQSDGKRLATKSGAADANVRIWDAVGFQEVDTLKSRFGTWTKSVTFSHDGWQLAAATGNGACAVAPTLLPPHFRLQ